MIKINQSFVFLHISVMKSLFFKKD